MKELTLIVREEWAGRRVDSLLRRELGMAPSYVSALKFRPDGVTLNGERVRADAPVRPGDRLSARIDDAARGGGAEPMDAPLDFVYEDEWLAVLNKAPGMAVHGAPGGACTLANALAARWGTEQTFHPVNRLDRGTSGLMVVAKSGYIHDCLRRTLHTDGFRREYRALAEGTVRPDAGRITLPLAPGEGVRRHVDPAGLPCETVYETLAAGSGLTLLRVVPLTGRTHQIRVHFAAVGHPLCGDALYGSASPRLERPALHSFALRLRHPVTGETLSLTAPLPPDLAALAAGLGYTEK